MSRKRIYRAMKCFTVARLWREKRTRLIVLVSFCFNVPLKCYDPLQRHIEAIWRPCRPAGCRQASRHRQPYTSITTVRVIKGTTIEPPELSKNLSDTSQPLYLLRLQTSRAQNLSRRRRKAVGSLRRQRWVTFCVLMYCRPIVSETL